MFMSHPNWNYSRTTPAGSLLGNRYTRSGIRINVRIIANDSPKRIAQASGPHRGDAAVSGSIPITVVMVVKNIGRNRLVADSTTISRRVLPPPAFNRTIIESMRMIAWLMITPASAITPSNEGNESG